MSIISSVYNELKSKIEHLPIEYGKYQRAFEALDGEEVTDIIVDNGVFWFEYPLYSELTDQQYALLVDYVTKHKGYKHLYADLVMPSVA